MASLLSSTFLPERFRGGQDPTTSGPPSWLNRKLTSTLQLLSTIACQHPIQTVVCVALAATGSYHGLLQESLFEGVGSGLVGKADWTSLVDGSRHIKTGIETGWKWQNFEGQIPVTNDADHIALLTFVFPGSDSSVTTGPDRVPLPSNLTVRPLPTTSNSLATYAQDKTLAYAVPYLQAPEFLSAAQEIPSEATEVRETEDGHEKRMWIMKAARVNPSSTVSQWAHNAWSEFLDLLKNAETLDIVIMILGYLAMHLTFVSLFVSMRRMGSNFWLAMSVLFSSTCAFLFGLAVTSQMGVPISVVLLSEGLPFLVVTIGFEKNIVLTRAVLSHAIEHRRPQNKRQNDHNRPQDADNNTIQHAVQAAIRDTGFTIVRDYAIEIIILVLGAASGVQGGLQQFCFLAAWILFFDGILLFSFYTAILSIKLEINRIKRHVDMRKALEDDGVSHRVAERVAGSSDWPPGNRDTYIFGSRVKSNSVPKFKVLMVTGFFIVNVVNLCTIPFRSTDSFSNISSWAKGLGGVVTTPPVDPFKVAGNGLDAILGAARAADRSTIVTVLTPIKYQLEYPSVHYAVSSSGTVENPDGLGYLGTYGVGGRVVGSLLKSLEDPVLSKWIIVALAMSVALNGYLFNAARWGIKDPNLPDHQIDPKDLARAQKVADNGGPTFPLGEYMPPSREHAPPTPAPTDDEGERRPAPVPRTQPHANIPVVNRNLDVLESMIRDKKVHEMTDEEVIAMCLRGKIPGHSLEKILKDFTRAVRIRRSIISRTRATAELTGTLDQSKLPYENYSWETVFGACCENVIGYMPLPVGVAGPIVVDGQSYFLPMATTEGVLVASTSRGAKAINAGGGAVTVLTHDGMTRGPVVSFTTLERAGAAKLWLDSEAGQASMEAAFNSTSRFAKLRGMKTAIAGTNLYIRFKATTGDAMGMNMISKGVENALKVMAEDAGFDDMSIISVSGNFCADKKAAALNWIDGRGKGVVAEAIIPADVVKAVLKTDVDSLVELNTSKNLIGSAMAGSIGGFNAHAANIVAAIFIATGQDPAQVVESANCITVMKNFNGALQISVSMPSIEVGTLGGGTILDPQGSMLDILGVRGSHPTTPGENARRLARIIGAAVLAGELSLCSALAAGHLVRAHMQHNRSAPPTRIGTPSIGGNISLVAPVGLAMTSISRR